MNITTAQVKEIRTVLAKLQPEKVTLAGNRTLSVKETVFALAPTLERMKKRGFDIQEIAEKLHEKGIEVKAPTLAKYLNEFRRGKGKKADTPPPQQSAGERCAERVVAAAQASGKDTPGKDRKIPQAPGGFVVVPDIPLDEL